MTTTWCSDGLETRSLDGISWMALDTETTGLDPGRHAIREYAAYAVTSRGEVTATASWHEDVDDEERFGAGLLEIAARIDAGAVLVAHNLAFDLSFLAVRPDVPAGVLRPSAWMCTLRMLTAPRSLERLAGTLGVTIGDRHTATGDARGLADLLAALLRHSSDRGIGTVGEMVSDAGGRSSRVADRTTGRATNGWSEIREQLDHVVPIPAITMHQRAVFDAAVRLLEDCQRGPTHPIESDALGSALRGAEFTACALDIVVAEMR